jgi:hypothetical protein
MEGLQSKYNLQQYLAGTLKNATEKKIAITLLSTFCFTDLDLGSQMIIFESILTTFLASIILETTGARTGSSLISNHHK